LVKLGIPEFHQNVEPTHKQEITSLLACQEQWDSMKDVIPLDSVACISLNPRSHPRLHGQSNQHVYSRKLGCSIVSELTAYTGILDGLQDYWTSFTKRFWQWTNAGKQHMETMWWY